MEKIKILVVGWDGSIDFRLYDTCVEEIEKEKNNQLSLRNDAVSFAFSQRKSEIFYRWDKGSLIFEQIKSPVDTEEVGKVYLGGSFLLREFSSSPSERAKLRVQSLLFQKEPVITTSLSLPTRVVWVACGANHTMILTEHPRETFVSGEGRFGELGLGHEVTDTRGGFLPIQLPLDEYPVSIAAGVHHSAVITAPEGYLYCFGCGSHYRLGHGSDENVFSPRRVEGLVGVGELDERARPSGLVLVACGPWHTVAVAKGSNDVFGMGWNNFGQLGSSSSMLDQPERLVVLDREDLLGEDSEENQIVSVACGSAFTALVTRSHRLLVL